MKSTIQFIACESPEVDTNPKEKKDRDRRTHLHSSSEKNDTKI